MWFGKRMAIRVPVAGFRFYKCLIVKKIMVVPVKNANPVTETGKKSGFTEWEMGAVRGLCVSS